MYAQLFGNYLLNHDLISNEQFSDAMENMQSDDLSIEIKLIYSGHVSGRDLDELSRETDDFGFSLEDLLLRDSFIDEDLLSDLNNFDAPKYLLLAQELHKFGILSWDQIEKALVDYQSDNEIFELDINPEKKNSVDDLIHELFGIASRPLCSETILYIDLLFNNLSQYIGDDYTVLSPSSCPEYPMRYCVLQSISGPVCINSYLDIDRDSTIEFASRYTHEEITDFDEYTRASVEDFVNLHNGLFLVNMSNDYNLELNLDPPLVSEGGVLLGDDDTFLLPIVYPFGTLNFLLHVTYSDAFDL